MTSWLPGFLICLTTVQLEKNETRERRDSYMSYEDLALHTDKYQINMMYAHWKNGTHNNIRVFEAFFRKNPFKSGYAVFAGLERIIRYLEHLHFTEEDIEYLRTQEEQYEEDFWGN